VYIAAYGRNLPNAFENVAKAMFNVMTDVEKIFPDIHYQLEVEGEDEHSLLYNWLENLLVKSEIDDIFFSEFEIKKISKKGDTLSLKASAWGEIIDKKKHVLKTAVKAITYHRMEINKNHKKVRIKVILDI